MIHSESLTHLAAALSKAQGSMGAAMKDAKNDHLRNSYATLGSVIATIQPVLAPNGLSYIQMPNTAEDGCMALTTRIMHESGEWIEDTMRAAIPQSKQSEIQAAGSVISYMRRYALSAAFGVMTEDDDGQGGQPRKVRTDNPAPKVNPVEEAKLQKWAEKIGEMAARVRKVAPAEEVDKALAAYQWRSDGQDASRCYENLIALGTRYAPKKEAEQVVVDAMTMATPEQIQQLQAIARSAGATTSDERAALWAYMLNQKGMVHTKSLAHDQALILLTTFEGLDSDERKQAFTEAKNQAKGKLL